MVGVTGPIGSGLPQLGFPRRLAMKNVPSRRSQDLFAADIEFLKSLVSFLKIAG
jgi:hypothetical protein